MENEIRPLAGLEYSEFEELLARRGWSEPQSAKLFSLIHRGGISSSDDLPDHVFSRKKLARLASQMFWSPNVGFSSKLSGDGSRKYIFQYADSTRVEALFMPSGRRDSICLSTQAGCAMGCTFCATGAMGLQRNLTALEILDQVHIILKDQKIPRGRQRRLNVFFMGMGEPLHNYDPVMKAFRILISSHGLGIPERDIGLSTCGYLPGIRKLAKESQRPCLMMSLGSVLPGEREVIMPVDKSWKLNEVLGVLEDYPLRRKEKIMLTYVLIQNENDSPAHGNALISISRKFPSMINVIPLNEHPFCRTMKEPDEERIQSFTRYLMENGVFCTIRRSRGRDIAGACGQFVQEISAVDDGQDLLDIPPIMDRIPQNSLINET